MPDIPFGTLNASMSKDTPTVVKGSEGTPVPLDINVHIVELASYNAASLPIAVFSFLYILIAKFSTLNIKIVDFHPNMFILFDFTSKSKNSVPSVLAEEPELESVQKGNDSTFFSINDDKFISTSNEDTN